MADHESLRGVYSGHPNVLVEPLGPLPPESYRVTYTLPGLTLRGESPVQTDRHVVEIRLPLGYPRDQPYCVAVTPIFHPNVAGHYCIADHWSAGQSLVDVVAEIGDIIQYRNYNPQSPLNAIAAYYAQQHPDLFPIGTVELGAPDVDIAIGRSSAGAA
jgi:ubiquitin-protein ligase